MRRPALAPLALAMACLWGAGPAGGAAALPGGLQVVQGQASVLTQGNQMTVTNSANALLNWQQFSIAAGNSVRFEQPSAASKVLNRVVGNDPSAIFGSLSSNGQVWLLNPNGVLFGATARVDVAGLVASTLNVGNSDWAAGRFSLGSAPGFADASVVNQGELRTTSGGRLLLIGGSGVRNEGLIDAPGGQVLLAAGHSVDLVDSGLPNLAVRISAPAGEVLNLGQVVAAGGRIDLQAAVVNQQGLVRADGFGAGPAGQVWLTGSDSVTAGAGSQTSARGDSTAGGMVTLQGRQIGLLDGALVDASGASGGDIRIGGGALGQDLSLRNADAVYMGAGATVRADATGAADGTGSGGRIVLWSDKATRVYGTLSARGGPLGGDGGLIETSGGWLDAQPLSVRTDALYGRAGNWLLDPQDILISSGDISNSHISTGPNFTSTGDVSRLNTSSIEAALNGGSNVTVTTGHTGGGAGDIQVIDALLVAVPSGAVSLTLNADRNILIEQSTLRSDRAALTLNLNAGQANLASGGAVAVRTSTLQTKGGDIVIGGNAVACGPNRCVDVGAVATDTSGQRDGIAVAGSTLDAGSGRISMRGFSAAQGGDASGVLVTDGATLSGSQITLRGGVDANGNYQRTGVKLGGGLVWATDKLDIDGAAYSGVYREVFRPTGVDVLSELRVGLAAGSPSAQLLINGRVNDANRPALDPGSVPLRRFAVGLRGANAKLVALGGASVSVDGQDLSSNQDYSIYAVGTAAGFIDSSAGGALSLSGNRQLLLKGELRTPEGKAFSMVSSGGAVTIDGASLSGNASQVRLTGSAVNIGLSGLSTQLVFGDATQVAVQATDFRIGQATLTIAPDGTNPLPIGQSIAPGTDTLRQALAVSGVPTANATLAAGGTISIAADNVLFGTSAVLHSAAAGNAVTLHGLADSGSVQTFENRAGSTVLSTPNGRWLVFAADSDNSNLLFSPGGLHADFRQYNATGSTTPAAAGKGFLFNFAPTLSFDQDVRRRYDGTDRFDLSALEVSLNGLKNGESVNGTWRVASKNASTASKALRLEPIGTGFTDANGAPVYGYQFDSESLVVHIDARPVAVSTFSAANKIYDGTVNAAVSGLTLSGVLTGESVAANGVGRFDTKNVGANKAVSLTSVNLTGTDAGNYLATLPDTTARANITAKAVTVSAGTLASKVYDGSASAPFTPTTPLTISGLVTGDTVSAAATSAAYADKRVGTGKTAQLNGVALAGTDAGNYSVSSATGQGSITARDVVVTAATAANKVYDGGTAATSASVAVSGVLEGDTVAARGTGNFDNKNIGSERSAALTSFSLTGTDAANYRVVTPPVGENNPTPLFVSTAAITPATLRYTADLLNLNIGTPIPVLTGGVAGLVGGETLAAATTGVLAFNTLATPASEPGSYAIAGSGLTAANYVFTQATSNAAALTIVRPPVVVPPPLPELNTSRNSVVTLLPAPAVTSAATGRSLDALQVVLPGASTDKQAFASLDLDHMSQQSVASVLAARDQYKKTIFSQAVGKLEQNPGLADAPGCASAEQAATGQCLMITPLSNGLAISNARVVERAGAVATAPMPAPTTAAAPAAVATAPSATPAAPAARPATAAPAEKARLLSNKQAFRGAALPKIERKIAILIGIDKYDDERIPKLGNAVADAEAVAESLRVNLGYETKVLQNPTRAEVFSMLNELAAEVQPANSVVLYYAGHGELVEKTGQGYWQPRDADASRPETWISNADIGRMLRQLPATQVAMISDSCFSGSLVSGERIRGVAGGQDADALLSHRAVVVMSSGGNEPVFDSGKNGHSTFSYALMQSLTQVATWKAGSSVFEQVRFAVAKQLPQRPVYGASSAGGHEQGGDYLFEQRQLVGPQR